MTMALVEATAELRTCVASPLLAGPSDAGRGNRTLTPPRGIPDFKSSEGASGHLRLSRILALRAAFLALAGGALRPSPPLVLPLCCRSPTAIMLVRCTANGLGRVAY